MTNIYIHIPFCSSKCNYCAFYSVANPHINWDEYFSKIKSEIEKWAGIFGRVNVPTVFFGGGTPSIMPVEIFSKIMGAMRKNFNILPDAEITMESNPGTLDLEKLIAFKNIGINRLSVGVQSLDDDELKFLGRKHNADDAVRLIKNSQDIGLNVSGDFIYGLPEHTANDAEKLCRKILDLELKHASLYELSIEPGTQFARQNIIVPTNEIVAEMYDIIGEMLPRYEVSNYAAPGFECKHNLNIWDGNSYIGIGPSACGRPLINGVWYEQKNMPDIFKPIDNKTRNLEMLMTGMRTTRGAKISDAVNLDFVNKNPDLVEIVGDRIRATKKGMLILDRLLIDLAL